MLWKRKICGHLFEKYYSYINIGFTLQYTEHQATCTCSECVSVIKETIKLWGSIHTDAHTLTDILEGSHWDLKN